MDIKKELLDIVSDYVDLPKEEIDFESDMKHSAGMNSFVLMSMSSAIEEHFNVSIPNEALANFRTLGDIVRFLEEHL